MSEINETTVQNKKKLERVAALVSMAMNAQLQQQEAARAEETQREIDARFKILEEAKQCVPDFMQEFVRLEGREAVLELPDYPAIIFRYNPARANSSASIHSFKLLRTDGLFNFTHLNGSDIFLALGQAQQVAREQLEREAQTEKEETIIVTQNERTTEPYEERLLDVLRDFINETVSTQLERLEKAIDELERRRD